MNIPETLVQDEMECTNGPLVVGARGGGFPVAMDQVFPAGAMNGSDQGTQNSNCNMGNSSRDQEYDEEKCTNGPLVVGARGGGFPVAMDPVFPAGAMNGSDQGTQNSNCNMGNSSRDQEYDEEKLKARIREEPGNIPIKKETPEEMFAKGMPVEDYIFLKEAELNAMGFNYRFKIKAYPKKRSFRIGDLVWAKMKGYPAWPGEIIAAPADEKPKKNHLYVGFFGSENHALINITDIEVHSEKLVTKHRNNKTLGFQIAIDAIIKRSKGTSKNLISKESSGTSNYESVLENNNKRKSVSSKNSAPKKFKKSPMEKKSASKISDCDPKNHPDDIHESPKMRCEKFSDQKNSMPFYYNVSGQFHQTFQNNVCPDTPPIDLTYKSDCFRAKNISPTSKKIGFLGLSDIGQGILKYLCHSGHSIIIWGERHWECQDFKEKFDILIADTAEDVIKAAEIIISCVSDVNRAKKIVFGYSDLTKTMEQQNWEGKCFVQMASMDPQSSAALSFDIKKNGGRYLEAPMIGSRIDANEGTLLVLAAGDESLYEECRSCFDAISQEHIFVGKEVGRALKFSVINNTLVGTMYASVAEALVLVKLFGLEGETFLDILKHGVKDCQVDIIEKGRAMLQKNHICNNPLKQTQQDMNLGLLFGDRLSLSTPIIAAANERYKQCKFMGYGDHDVSAIFAVLTQRNSFNIHF